MSNFNKEDFSDSKLGGYNFILSKFNGMKVNDAPPEPSPVKLKRKEVPQIPKKSLLQRIRLNRSVDCSGIVRTTEVGTERAPRQVFEHHEEKRTLLKYGTRKAHSVEVQSRKESDDDTGSSASESSYSPFKKLATYHEIAEVCDYRNGVIVQRRTERLDSDGRLRQILSQSKPGETTLLIIPVKCEADLFDASDIIVKKEESHKSLSLDLHLSPDFLQEKVKVRCVSGGKRITVTAFKHEPLGDGSKYVRRYSQYYELPHAINYDLKVNLRENGDLNVQGQLKGLDRAHTS